MHSVQSIRFLKLCHAGGLTQIFGYCCLFKGGARNDFINRMKDYLDKGVEVSKDAISKAGEKVADFGGKSVVRIEISQLESKAQKELLTLGTLIYEKLSIKGESSVDKSDVEISAALAVIDKLRAEIESRKSELEEAQKNS